MKIFYVHINVDFKSSIDRNWWVVAIDAADAISAVVNAVATTDQSGSGLPIQTLLLSGPDQGKIEIRNAISKVEVLDGSYAHRLIVSDLAKKK